LLILLCRQHALVLPLMHKEFLEFHFQVDLNRVLFFEASLRYLLIYQNKILFLCLGFHYLLLIRESSSKEVLNRKN